MKEIVLAGGCFWGVEEYFSRIPGVEKTRVGYANGKSKNPTYEDVCSGTTNHAEAVYITYRESELSLENLLDAYWKIIDPTVLNRQGPDMGTQYRTGIYYIDLADVMTIDASLKAEQLKHAKPIVTERTKLTHFFNAEDYHQRYLKKHPGGYCHIPLD